MGRLCLDLGDGLLLGELAEEGAEGGGKLEELIFQAGPAAAEAAEAHERRPHQLRRPPTARGLVKSPFTVGTI